MLLALVSSVRRALLMAAVPKATAKTVTPFDFNLFAYPMAVVFEPVFLKDSFEMHRKN